MSDYNFSIERLKNVPSFDKFMTLKTIPCKYYFLLTVRKRKGDR